MVLDYILDPQGEVFIVIRNPNAPFAVWRSTTDEDGKPPTPSKEGDVNESLIESDAETDGGTVLETTPGAFDHNLGEPERDVRIQASARHLMLGSPVFNRMLNGGWSEDRQLKEKGSVELVVDGWDVEALVVVLNIIHSHLLKVPRKVTVEQLAKIAVIADYYDCKSVQFFGGLWIRAISKEPPSDYSRHMVLCLWASYFFNYRTLFTTYSSAAMEKATCHISSLRLPIPGNILRELFLTLQSD